MNAQDIKDALRVRHPEHGGAWVCVEEAFSGWTSRSGGIDLLAIGAWQTAKAPGLPGCGLRPRRRMASGRIEVLEPDPTRDTSYPMVAYEVKVTRSDFRRDLYGPGTKTRPQPGKVWPYKQRDALAQSHYFMFAVPEGLLKDEEIEFRMPPQQGRGLWLPPEAGLVEVTEDGQCRVRVAAPRRECPEPLNRGMIAELIRHAVNPAKSRDLELENRRLASENERLREQINRYHGYADRQAA